jgi:hypothetical protein
MCYNIPQRRQISPSTLQNISPLWKSGEDQDKERDMRHAAIKDQRMYVVKGRWMLLPGYKDATVH